MICGRKIMQHVLAFLCVVAIFSSSAQSQETTQIPCDWNTVAGVQDTVMDVVLHDGALVENVVGIQRDFLQARTGLVQGIRVFRMVGDSLVDTVYNINHVVRYTSGGIGGTHAPLSRDILPVREYQKVEELAPLNNVVDIGVFGSYAGADESDRKVGVDQLLFGLKANVSPFNGVLGNSVFPAIQLGIAVESGRMRFPIGAQLRMNVVSGSEIVDTIKYMPDMCSFQYPGNATPVQPPNDDYEELQRFGRTDSTAVLLREKGEYATGFRLDAFVEGGTLLNSGFEGAGKNPSVNPDDYGQWYAGGGLIASFDWFFVGLGYEYYKLSVRTPCENCEDLFLVNTNETHTVELRFGYMLWWR